MAEEKSNKERVKEILDELQVEGYARAEELRALINDMCADIINDSAAEVLEAVRIAREIAYEEGYQAAKEEYYGEEN